MFETDVLQSSNDCFKNILSSMQLLIQKASCDVTQNRQMTSTDVMKESKLYEKSQLKRIKLESLQANYLLLSSSAVSDTNSSCNIFIQLMIKFLISTNYKRNRTCTDLMPVYTRWLNSACDYLQTKAACLLEKDVFLLNRLVRGMGFETLKILNFVVNSRLSSSSLNFDHM